MTKREFTALLNRVTTGKGKAARLDPRKIAQLTSDEKSAMVYHIVRNRGPVLADLIPANFDTAWLNCCGYMYRSTSKVTGLRFVHTAAHIIK